MGRAEKLSVELTPELSDMVRGMVESGEFSSPDEAVISVLIEWRSSHLTDVYTAEELGALWDEGIASGDPIDGEEAFLRIEQKLKRHLAGKTRQ
jgi:antitoxin ParD1/3/4